MTKNSIFRGLIVAGVCCGLFVLGCEQQVKSGPAEAKSPAQQQEQATGKVKVALKSAVGDLDTYKIVTQARRATKWQGPVPAGATFDENFNEERVEIVVTRRVQDLDASGAAAAQVTINGLKCLFKSKDKTSLDFDSSKKSDTASALSKLIGNTYSIEFNTSNYITSVFDMPQLSPMMTGDTESDNAAMKIVSPDSIIERHCALRLPLAGSDMIKPGDKWSVIKTFPFGKMGLKSYEKIFTLREIKGTGAHKIAVIDMNAIPSSEVEPKYQSQKAEVDVPKMFDTNDSYAGSGELNLQTGKIENYHENFSANWTVAIPSNGGQTRSEATSEPVVLHMSSTYAYNMERVK